MNSLRTIRVLIADDHSLVIEGLKALLERVETIEVVDVAVNGTDVLLKLKNQDIDIVLLDINMPKMDGIETCQILKKEFPSVKVLALSTYDDGEMISRMIRNGASGYVLKNISSSELTSAIEKVMAGERVLDSKLTMRMIDSIQNEEKVLEIKPTLTRREKEVLSLIADELTTQQIADQLYLSSNTILSHRKNLFSKFRVDNSIGLIKKAIEFGFI